MVVYDMGDTAVLANCIKRIDHMYSGFQVGKFPHPSRLTSMYV